MPTLKEHLENENLHKINRAWQYMNTSQRASIFLRAFYWSLPSIHQLIHAHQQRTQARITYMLYQAHWINQ